MQEYHAVGDVSPILEAEEQKEEDQNESWNDASGLAAPSFGNVRQSWGSLSLGYLVCVGFVGLSLQQAPTKPPPPDC